MMRFRLPIRLSMCAACLSACIGTEPEPGPFGTRVRILLAFPENDTGRFADYPARIREIFRETQTVFSNSDTRVVLEIAAIAPVPFDTVERIADLQALVRKRDGRMDGIHALRDGLEADIVVLFSPLFNATINGSVLAAEGTAFAIAGWAQAGAPEYGLAHEMAHLFGAMHPGETGPVPGQLPGGFSWGDDSIRTVMDWSAGRTLPYFSNPGISIGGKALGVAGKQDIAGVIRTTAAYIANFRGPRTSTDFIPAGTIPSADFSE